MLVGRSSWQVCQPLLLKARHMLTVLFANDSACCLLPLRMLMLLSSSFKLLV